MHPACQERLVVGEQGFHASETVKAAGCVGRKQDQRDITEREQGWQEEARDFV